MNPVQLVKPLHSSTVQLIHQDSGNVEWGTIPLVIHTARKLMSGLDLDVCSSLEHYKRYNKEYPYENFDWFGILDEPYRDGLEHRWFGNFWCNPPFPKAQAFVNKAIYEYELGNVKKGCILTFNSTETKWFQKLGQFPQFFFKTRLSYYDGDILMKQPPKGSVLTYLYNPYDIDKKSALQDLEETFSESFEGFAK